MSNYRHLIAAAALATVVTLTPTVAEAGTAGSVTAREGHRVIIAADTQQCLTLKEVRRLVHGSGVKAAGDYSGRYQTWRGKGRVSFLDVTFEHGCAYGVWLDYDNGRQLAWTDQNNPAFR